MTDPIERLLVFSSTRNETAGTNPSELLLSEHTAGTLAKQYVGRLVLSETGDVQEITSAADAGPRSDAGRAKLDYWILGKKRVTLGYTPRETSFDDFRELVCTVIQLDPFYSLVSQEHEAAAYEANPDAEVDDWDLPDWSQDAVARIRAATTPKAVFDAIGAHEDIFRWGRL